MHENLRHLRSAKGGVHTSLGSLGVHARHFSLYETTVYPHLPTNPSPVQHRSSPICICRRSRSCIFTFKYGPILPAAPLAFAYQSELPILSASSLAQVTALTAPPLAVCQSISTRCVMGRPPWSPKLMVYAHGLMEEIAVLVRDVRAADVSCYDSGMRDKER